MTYTKEDLNSDIPRIRRKAKDYFEGHGLLEEKVIEATEESFEDKTVDELKDLLRAKDMKVSGTKEELIERLEDAE